MIKSKNIERTPDRKVFDLILNETTKSESGSSEVRKERDEVTRLKGEGRSDSTKRRGTPSPTALRAQVRVHIDPLTLVLRFILSWHTRQVLVNCITSSRRLGQ